jgi:hypothetical protein
MCSREARGTERPRKRVSKREEGQREKESMCTDERVGKKVEGECGEHGRVRGTA